MNRKSVGRPAVILGMIAVCVIAVPHSIAQRPGLSANGGSLSRNRTEPPARRNHESEPMFYRRIVLQLGFDFPDLEESYWTARTRDPNLTFPTLLKTQIAVEMKAPGSADSAMGQLLEALASSR